MNRAYELRQGSYPTGRGGGGGVRLPEKREKGRRMGTG